MANNLGDTLLMQGSWAESRNALQEAIRLGPQMSAAHWNLPLLLLLTGDWERGFAEYKWRIRQSGNEANRHSQPRWDGSSLASRTILLHAEQGCGDAIHFARDASMVAARGGKVVLECQPLLDRNESMWYTDDALVSADKDRRVGDVIRRLKEVLSAPA